MDTVLCSIENMDCNGMLGRSMISDKIALINFHPGSFARRLGKNPTNSQAMSILTFFSMSKAFTS